MPRTSSACEPRVAVSSLCADSCGLLMASRMVVGSWPQCDSLNSLSCNVIHRQRRSVQSLLPQTQHLLPCTEYAEDEASCPMARQCRDLANRCTARGPGGVALGVLVFRATAADSFQRNIVHIRVEARSHGFNRPASSASTSPHDEPGRFGECAAQEGRRCQMQHENRSLTHGLWHPPSARAACALLRRAAHARPAPLLKAWGGW